MVNTEELIIHHLYEGNLVPIDSDEGKYYLQKEKSRLYFECLSILNDEDFI